MFIASHEEVPFAVAGALEAYWKEQVIAGVADQLFVDPYLQIVGHYLRRAG